MEFIFRIVKNETTVTKEILRSGVRKREFVRARAIFSALAYARGYSYNNIAKEIRKDHTTIIHLMNTYGKSDFITELISKYAKENEQALERFNNISPLAHHKYGWLYEKYGGKCAICSFDEVIEVHHIKPRYLGGTDHPENLIVLCPNHHALADRGMLIINKKNG